MTPEQARMLQDIHDAVVGSTEKVGLIALNIAQDVKMSGLEERIKALEVAKATSIRSVLDKLFTTAWAAFMGWLLSSSVGNK